MQMTAKYSDVAERSVCAKTVSPGTDVSHAVSRTMNEKRKQHSNMSAHHIIAYIS